MLTKTQMQNLISYLVDSRSQSTIIDRVGLAETQENQDIIIAMYEKHYNDLYELSDRTKEEQNEILANVYKDANRLTTL